MNADEETVSPDWFAEDFATFGDRVAAAREAMGLSQSDLSARLGVKLKTVRDWEEDLNDPRANKLQMMSGVLNVSISWLLTGVGEGPEAPLDASDAIVGILAEMRDLQREITNMGDRIGALEKRLRAAL